MTTLKVGDRVRSVHVSQCRKLVKKERRRVKVAIYDNGSAVISGVLGKPKWNGEVVEFVEVRKRK